MKKSFLMIFVGTAILGFILCSTFFFMQLRPTKSLPALGKVQDFQLLDINYQPFGLKNLKEKVWVVDFMFTTCGNICPIMTKNMAKLYRSYQLEDDVAFVSISVNPEQDTVETLKKYADEQNAIPGEWDFLTGSREEITRVAVESFKLGALDESIFHSPHFVLVDKNAQIRGYYDGTVQEEIRRLFQDIAHLIKSN